MPKKNQPTIVVPYKKDSSKQDVKPSPTKKKLSSSKGGLKKRLKNKMKLKSGAMSKMDLNDEEMCEAIEKEDFEAVKKIISERSHAIHCRNVDRQTPLHLACKLGNIALVDTLLTNKADPQTLDVNHYTPFHLALQQGHLRVAELLVFSVSDQSFTTINAKNNSTPLHTLASLSPENCTDYKCDEEEEFLMSWEHVSRELLNNGVSINLLNDQGRTALHNAAETKYGGTTRMLVEWNASISPTDGEIMNTPLHLAVQSCNFNAVLVLLERGADRHQLNSEGISPAELSRSVAPDTPLSRLLLGVSALPDIILLTIFSYLLPSELGEVCLVCKQFKMLASNDIFWKDIYNTMPVRMKKLREKGNYLYKELLGDWFNAKWLMWFAPGEVFIEEEDVTKSHDYLFKIMLVGDEGTGKSAFLGKFVGKKYVPFPPNGKDKAFKSRLVRLHTKRITVEIWERRVNKSKTRRFENRSPYRQVHGVVLIFNPGQKSTFDNLPLWYADIKRTAETIPIMIVATHSDMIDEYEVSHEEAEEFAKKAGVPLVWTSAKTGKHVHLAVRIMLEQLYSQFVSKGEPRPFSSLFIKEPSYLKWHSLNSTILGLHE